MARKLYEIASYFAILEPERPSGFSVSFPDFPGCVTFGKTFEEARTKGAELLELWLEELAAQKRFITRRSERPIIDELRVRVPAKVGRH